MPAILRPLSDRAVPTGAHWEATRAHLGANPVRTLIHAPSRIPVRCDTSKTVTPVVAAGPRSRLFSGARVEKMGTEMILGVIIVSPVLFIAAASRWASEEWLRAFVILARSLGRPM